MTLVAVIASLAGSGSVGTTASPTRELAGPADAAGVGAPPSRYTSSRTFCPSARKAVRWYRGRHADWLRLRRATSLARGRSPRNCADARYLASVWKSRSFAARTQTERWLAVYVLEDFTVTDGNRAWRRAVTEAQKPYPGTEAWLLSCSASEGGWGRWVPNSQGSGVGGWLQFHPGTFAGFSWRARTDVASRGFIVPASTSSWYSPLGQALAGAWGLTHGMRHHWHGSGC